MPKFKEPHLNVQLVRRYLPIEMRGFAFEFERLFHSYLDGSVNVTNLPPNTPADQPRFTMGGGKKFLMVSNNATLLQLNFESLPKKEGATEGAIHKAAAILDSTDAFYESAEKSYSGIVMQFSLPNLEDARDTVKFLANQFLNERLIDEEIESYSTSIVKSDGIYRTLFHADEYKTYSVTFTGNFNQINLAMDTDFLTPEDSGLLIKVDVSTKGDMSTRHLSPFKGLTNKAFEMFSADVANYLGGILEIP